MEDSIKKILSTIDDAIAKFQDSVPGIQKMVYEELQPLIKQIQIKDGKLLNNVENLKLIGNVKNKLEKIIISAEYKKSVEKFIDSFSSVSNLQQEYFKQFGQQFKAKKTLPIIKELAVESTINDLVGQGMKSSVIDPVQKILNENITTGGNYAKFQEQLRNHILTNDTGEGSLERYTKQITTDAIHQYNAQYHDAIAQDLQFNWGRYVGSNITTSREFCIFFTKKQWVHKSELPEVIKGHIDGHNCKISKTTGLPLGMIPGTTIDNFKIRRGGYNCGHQFFWVPDSAVPENIKNKPEPVSEFVNVKKVVDWAGPDLDQKLFKKLKGPIEVLQTHGEGSFYNPNTDEINFDPFQSRSSIFKEVVTYHEFGHALHYHNEVVTAFKVADDFKKVYNSAKKALKPSIENTMKQAREILRDYRKEEFVKKYNFKESADVKESLSIVFDIVGSLTNGQYGGGHSAGYYRNFNGAYSELFAHGNYLHFSENKLIEELLPDVTKVLREYFKNFHQE